MIVCICNNINEKQVKEHVRHGHVDPYGIQYACGGEPNCGKCIPFMNQLILEEQREMGEKSINKVKLKQVEDEKVNSFECTEKAAGRGDIS